MSSEKYREKTRLLPLNLLSQQHLQSPSKHRHIISNAAIPRVLRKDSASQDFESLLKSSNYPYLSKINFGRRRHTSNKRPDNINRSPMEERFIFKTEIKKGSLSESKGKSRYQKRQSDGQAVGKVKRFFDGTEDSDHLQRPTRNPQNNRSYFLKKLKERYGNKHIHCSTEKTEMKINSEKVTLMQHSHQKTQDVFEDEHGVQTMILSDPLNFKTPQEIIKKYGDTMKQYEKDVQIHDYPEIYYFNEDCLEMGQPPEGQTAQSAYDDKEGGYLWKPRGHIAYRYEIVSLLGQGSFGQVFRCIDHKDDEEVAVKLVRNRQKYTKQAQVEIEILSYVRQNDPNMNKNLVEVKDNFRWREHTVKCIVIQCIIFELLSINLYELIKMNDYYGLPLDLIRRFSLQILNGLHFLHKHQIIHADLKPQNILLKQPNKSGLKIIDFGSSCFIKQRIYTYIQSRYYRAPQVILGVPYDFKIDIWSFACILAELYIGYPIFPGENEKQQIWLIMQTIGCPPLGLLENSTRKHHYFDESLRPLQYNSNKGKEYKVLGNPLSDVVDEKDKSFCRFLEFCLTWQPQSRPTALECLKHQWILEGLPEDIRKQHLKFIEQQELIMKAERRKRSPPVREMKMNESPPVRARPPYFDRSRQRNKGREGLNNYPLSKNFHGIEGFRTRQIHPL